MAAALRRAPPSVEIGGGPPECKSPRRFPRRGSDARRRRRDSDGSAVPTRPGDCHPSDPGSELPRGVEQRVGIRSWTKPARMTYWRSARVSLAPGLEGFEDCYEVAPVVQPGQRT